MNRTPFAVLLRQSLHTVFDHSTSPCDQGDVDVRCGKAAGGGGRGGI